jgi:hypothetical protein
MAPQQFDRKGFPSLCAPWVPYGRAQRIGELNRSAVLDSAGICPPGDPTAIAELASTLRRVAAQVTSTSTPSLGRWESPAARLAGDDLRHADRATRRAAETLCSCASILDTAADYLASDQRSWRARQGDQR